MTSFHQNYTIISKTESFLPFSVSEESPSKTLLPNYSKRIPLNAPILVHIHEKNDINQHLFSLVSMIGIDFDLSNHLKIGIRQGVMLFLAKDLNIYEARMMTNTIYTKAIEEKVAKYHIQFDSTLKCAPILNPTSIVQVRCILIPKGNFHHLSSPIQKKRFVNFNSSDEYVNKDDDSKKVMNSSKVNISGDDDVTRSSNEGVCGVEGNGAPSKMKGQIQEIAGTDQVEENEAISDTSEHHDNVNDIEIDSTTQKSIEKLKNTFEMNWHGNIIIRNGYYLFPAEDQIVEGYDVMIRIEDWEDRHYLDCKFVRLWKNRSTLQWGDNCVLDSEQTFQEHPGQNSLGELDPGSLHQPKVNAITNGNIDSQNESLDTPLKNLNMVFNTFIETQSTFHIENLLKNSVNGIVVYGSTGVGKSYSCKKLVKKLGFGLIYLSLSSIPHDTLIFSISELSKILKKPKKKRQVIILDDLHIIKEIPAAMSILTMAMDSLKNFESLSEELHSNQFSFIGITRKISHIPEVLRRHGRFDHEVHFLPTTIEERKKILSKFYFSALNTSIDKKTSSRDLIDKQFDQIAAQTVGYVTSDLITLHREANILYHQEKKIDNNLLFKPIHYELVLRNNIIKPTLQKEEENVINVIDQVKDIGWSDIGGLEEVKKKLRQCAEWPLKFKTEFQKLGLSAPRGILMYGPPGCGKTSLVKALARSTKSAFLSLNSAAVYSPYFGDAEKTIREVFKKARLASPSILFFDEIDAMVGNREKSTGSGVEQRVLSTILNEMDGIEYTRDVLVVAATNRPDMIDAALLRPGRLDYVVYIPPPDYDSRLETFKVHCKHLPLGNDVCLEALAHETEGFTGADIESLCREAAMHALREDISSSTVQRMHFSEAKYNIHPSVTNEMIIEYESFQEEFVKSK